MTPVPKNLSPQGVLAWRRAIARGTSPYTAGSNAQSGYGMYPDGTDETSLDRHINGSADTPSEG